MERKTYYMILGVSSTESDSGIRAAYRDLAKRLHPDVAGAHATRSFQEVSEAYGVLSDPQRRRAYNQQLNLAEAGRMQPAPPGPLVSESVPILVNRDGTRPSSEAIYERSLGNFASIRVPKSERLLRLNLEVLLTRKEASRGCVVPVGVPVLSSCPQCGGSGRDWGSPCAYCQQRGIVESEDLLHVRIPPMAPSESIYEIPLRSLGRHDLYLRLHILVEAQPR